MAKVSKEQQWRMEGISYAVRFMEEGHDLQELKAEARMRGAYNIPLKMSHAEYDSFMLRACSSIVDAFMLLSCMVLRTEFKFGATRIERFKRAYEERAKDMTDGLFSWSDLQWMIEKELGLKEEATA